jgi:cyclohexa-1,5-dienecarbonyl-CoA hydratase
MNTSEGPVRLAVEREVAYVTLDSPPVNILTCAVMDLLSEALEEIGANDSVKAVALRSEGRAFSAGADVGEHAPEKAPQLIASFSRMFRLFGALEVPVVMAVDGAALGAGFELVMMADVLLAGDRAKFGQPEMLIGFFAPVGVAWLPALVGTAKAMEITCTGRSYSGPEMRDCGLVTQVVPSAELEAATEAYLDDFRKMSPLVMRLNVSTLKRLRGRPFEEARLEAEKVFLDELMVTEDVKEGIASFTEKRKPVWKNA